MVRRKKVMPTTNTNKTDGEMSREEDTVEVVDMSKKSDKEEENTPQ